MITTQERIQNPVEFLEADPSILDSLNQGESQVLSGTDFDVEIYKNRTDDLREVGHTSREVSRLLGNLYSVESVFGHETETGSIDLHWYPSAIALEGITGALGLTPGYDAFSMRYYDGERGWNETYAQKLGSTEFPLATKRGTGPYRHLETVSALILAPQVTHEIVRIAGAKKSKKSLGYIGHEAATSFENYAPMMDRLVRVQDGILSLAEAVRPQNANSGTALHPPFWQLKGDGWIPTINSAQKRIAEMSLEYLEVLRPKLDELKAA